MRVLDATGEAQARGLVAGLRDVSLERALCSPQIRCRQTLEPLAAARGLEIEPADTLDQGAEPRQVLSLLGRLGGRPCVLCTHADVVLGVLEPMVREGRLLTTEVRYEPAGTWVLEMAGPAPRPVRYLAPPPPRTAGDA